MQIIPSSLSLILFVSNASANAHAGGRDWYATRGYNRRTSSYLTHPADIENEMTSSEDMDINVPNMEDVPQDDNGENPPIDEDVIADVFNGGMTSDENASSKTLIFSVIPTSTSKSTIVNDSQDDVDLDAYPNESIQSSDEFEVGDIAVNDTPVSMSCICMSSLSVHFAFLLSNVVLSSSSSFLFFHEHFMQSY